MQLFSSETLSLRRNDDLPECLGCGSKATKEHHFTQTWCRGKRMWESECICLDCQNWSFRAYKCAMIIAHQLARL